MAVTRQRGRSAQTVLQSWSHGPKKKATPPGTASIATPNDSRSRQDIDNSWYGVHDQESSDAPIAAE